MLSLMEKMCRRREGTKASRSRVTYSRVALVISLWDQTGPTNWSPPWNGGVTSYDAGICPHVTLRGPPMLLPFHAIITTFDS